MTYGYSVRASAFHQLRSFGFDFHFGIIKWIVRQDSTQIDLPQERFQIGGKQVDMTAQGIGRGGGHDFIMQAFQLLPIAEHQEPHRTITERNQFFDQATFLELFDVRDLIVHNWPLIGWNIWGIAVAYALIYTSLLVFGAWLVFRRKSFQ